MRTFSRSPLSRLERPASDQPVCLRFGHFLSLKAILIGSDALGCALQKFRSQGIRPEVPAAADLLPVFTLQLLLRPSIHVPRERLPGSRTIAREPHFTQESIHSEPRPALSGRKEVLRIAAPWEIAKSLILLQQVRANRIQVHLVTNRAQVTERVCVNYQGLVATAEEVPNELVPAVEP